MNKLTAIMLTLVSIPLTNAIDISNSTNKDIVIRIKNNQGVTIIQETKVSAGSLKEVGDLFQEDADKAFPLHIRIWFAKDYKSPTNYQHSDVLTWEPTAQQINEELTIHARRASGAKPTSNQLVILHNNHRFSYRYQSSVDFFYDMPRMHPEQHETHYSGGTELKGREGKKEERAYSSGTILD